MTLSTSEFLRRFTLHILPRGFVRIRQFGYLTNTRRTSLLAAARLLLTSNQSATSSSRPEGDNSSTWPCPRCNGQMRFGPNLSARQLASRCTALDSS